MNIEAKALINQLEKTPLQDKVFFWFMRKIKKLKRWVQHRTTRRYHMLKLHDPGYSDPTYQMIFAVMGIVERYVQELRVTWYGEEDTSNLSDIEVLNLYISWMEEELEKGWWIDAKQLNTYLKTRNIIYWWNKVKDNTFLDGYTDKFPEEYEDKEEGKLLTSEYINYMLKEAIDHRQGMWT